MPVVTLLGAKGGVGSSLVATNLALALNGRSGALLVDLDLSAPSSDLLLDLTPERSWADLLPVADEFTERDLQLASTVHSLGLALLASPVAPPSGRSMERLPLLLKTLARYYAWIVLDVGGPLDRSTRLGLSATNMLLVVVTPDPPALRGAHRLCQSLPASLSSRTGLVINQHSEFHPLNPEAVSRSLDLPIMGVLPRESRPVAEQVNFGRPVMTAQGSLFWEEINRLAERLMSPSSQRRVGDSEVT